MNDTENFIRRH